MFDHRRTTTPPTFKTKNIYLSEKKAEISDGKSYEKHFCCCFCCCVIQNRNLEFSNFEIIFFCFVRLKSCWIVVTTDAICDQFNLSHSLFLWRNWKFMHRARRTQQWMNELSVQFKSKLEQEPHEFVHGRKLLDLCLFWCVLVYENETDREESRRIIFICATAAQLFMWPQLFAYFHPKPESF